MQHDNDELTRILTNVETQHDKDLAKHFARMTER